MTSFAQQYIVSFEVQNKEEAYQLPDYVIVDKAKGNTITAYLYGDNFEKFKELGYDFKLEPHPSEGKDLTMATTVAEMANWDRYPTHEVYLQMMQDLATNYPNICRLETIGTSEAGRPVQVLKISDNPDIDENEPEFFYTGQMHGDEIVAYILFLKLAYYLTENYEKDQKITDLINNVEIWINPLSNPDGTYHGGNNTVSNATRANSNGVDLNRNFPSPNLPNPSNQDAAEVQMMIAFAENHNFVLSANTHSGAELVNFPWDSWTSNVKTHADHTWWEQVSHNYTDQVHLNAPASYMDSYDDGVTHGGDWYIADGTRQDHMGYYQNGREVTIELSNNKMLDCNLLPNHWVYNRDAMVGYIEETFYGIRGIVTDENENPLQATISIADHDIDNSEIVTDPTTGDYHRMIDDGTYNLTFTVAGYTPITVNNISVTDNEITIVDVMFAGTPGTTTLSGIITNQETGLPIENAEIIITGQDDTYTVNTNATGAYSVSDVTVGTYQFQMSATGYMSAVYYETVSTSDHDVSKYLIPTLTLTGTVIDALTAQPIDGATVSLIGTSSESTTDINGEYSISLFEGEYEIKAFKSGYAQQITTETINSTNNVVDFALLEANAITFEEEIPANFTYSDDADWIRTTNNAYEGSYSMKSGTITDNQSTSMQFTETTEAGYISFYKKVSSESEYDLLHFYIDENEKNSWSGEVDWSQESYAITAGSHTFKWTYDKDGSQSSGGDCAWVDYIELPATSATTHTVSFTVKNGSTAEVIEGATVNLTGYGSKITNSSGIATFTDVYETTGTNAISYTVSASGFSNETGDIQVLGDVNQVVNMQVDTGIDELSNYVNVFPNPSDGIFKIETPTNDGQIIIYNTNGAEIFHQSINSTKTKIDLSNKPTGIYLMKFYSNEGVSVQKLILN